MAIGQYYLRARYYDPIIGRLTQLDTFEGGIAAPLSLNRYAYADANPVSFVDPTGHFDLSVSFTALSGISLEAGFATIGLSLLRFRHLRDRWA